MEKLIVLGTGNAQAVYCYNTCFALKNGEEYFLTDAGGGNGILAILEKKNIPMEKIHHIFVSHAHNDHVLGVIWMVRMIGTAINKGSYEGNLHIYCHLEMVETIRTICYLTVSKKFTKYFDDRILFHVVSHGEEREILGDKFTFFDISSIKQKQFGYSISMANGVKVSFLGDEPYKEVLHPFVEGADWLLHEAFCVYGERERFNPYEKQHGTVKDAAEIAESMHIPNLILWHTEDKDMAHRQEKYLTEGKAFYNGNLYIPEDGEEFDL